jgi:hypothetical protein
MAHEAFVQCRVSVETKALLKSVATQKVLPESVVLRQLIETVPRGGVAYGSDSTGIQGTAGGETVCPAPAR